MLWAYMRRRFGYSSTDYPRSRIVALQRNLLADGILRESIPRDERVRLTTRQLYSAIDRMSNLEDAETVRLLLVAHFRILMQWMAAARGSDLLACRGRKNAAVLWSDLKIIVSG